MIKLSAILKEVRTRVQNLKYYEVILQQSPFSYKTKTYFQRVIDSINKQGGLATPNQFFILQKLKRGELNE